VVKGTGRHQDERLEWLSCGVPFLAGGKGPGDKTLPALEASRLQQEQCVLGMCKNATACRRCLCREGPDCKLSMIC